MTEELKPCPFCGGEAELDWGSATDIGGDLYQSGWVSCKNADCGASIDIDSINDNNNSIDLANKWNQRTSTIGTLKVELSTTDTGLLSKLDEIICDHRDDMPTEMREEFVACLRKTHNRRGITS